jgi:hypothetical protein
MENAVSLCDSSRWHLRAVEVHMMLHECSDPEMHRTLTEIIRLCELVAHLIERGTATQGERSRALPAPPMTDRHQPPRRAIQEALPESADDALDELEQKARGQVSPAQIVEEYGARITGIARGAEEQDWLFNRALGCLQRVLEEAKRARRWDQLPRIVAMMEMMSTARRELPSRDR